MGRLLFYDFEVFKYNWLVCAIDPFSKQEYVIVDDVEALRKLHNSYKKDIWVGYNSRGYDQWILRGILCGFNPKEINDFIIVEKHKGHEFSTLLHKIKFNNYDVMPNPPVSLKTLEGFMGKSIVETSIPFDIDRPLTQTEINEVIRYCRYDVQNTIEVFIKRKSEFNAHLSLIKTFDLPLSNIGKTQAQLAAIILEATKKRFDDTWDIRLPDTLKLDKYKIVSEWFLNKENHDIKKTLEIDISGVPHVIAWGGVHGAIKQFNETCKDDEIFIMADVNQLYPTIMIEYDLLSRAVSNKSKFKGILDTSLRLKAEKKKVEREPYKRICNITYGTEGDKFNSMYDPLHRTLVCVYGQVLIIDLIEKLEDVCKLIQSNTDGILVKVKKDKLQTFYDVCSEWEQRTRLTLGYESYIKVIQKDVNNYVIVAENGDTKTKGAYVKKLSDLDYDLPIVNEAIVQFLLNDIPVEYTVNNCDDLRKFQKIVKVSSKYSFAMHNGKQLNEKTFRVYASKRSSDTYIGKCKGEGLTNEKFANTPEKCFIWNDDVNGVTIPNYLDKQWYIDLAKKRIKDFIGG